MNGNTIGFGCEIRELAFRVHVYTIHSIKCSSGFILHYKTLLIDVVVCFHEWEFMVVFEKCTVYNSVLIIYRHFIDNFDRD